MILRYIGQHGVWLKAETKSLESHKGGDTDVRCYEEGISCHVILSCIGHMTKRVSFVNPFHFWIADLLL